MRKDIAGPQTKSSTPMWEGLKDLVAEALADGATEADVAAVFDEVTEYMERLAMEAGEQESMFR